ncbi:ABC transporter substrate-binding protein [Actinoplanes sp. TBRC 11911]|uniref:ABC transporter substrate-binding protein n=1 Tax=Actinoplanes sp. TBRC 11911 TaxID=2729386 RepID=UPI00145F3968|nr:ABC transporter substrate-binding protein [Actinoplanes sp. TBRC 11911]NMO50107.1 ABC transporter substrate-binding protein [Actinoplanes sp. TBRC 11911]
MKRPVLATATALVLATTTLSACGSPGSSAAPPAQAGTGSAVAAGPLPSQPGSITLGSADFPESEILAYLYADAFKAKGVQVKVHANIGERPVYTAALSDGSIGGVVDYSGAMLDYLNHGNPAHTPQDVYTQLQKAASAHGFAVSAYAPAQDVDTITVTRATATKYHLTTIADLQPVASKLALGAPAPFQTVSYGTKALAASYGVKFGRFVALQPSGSITQTALKNGTVDAADIFSTDPSISRDNFVTLTDPKSIFAAENVVPVFKNNALTQPMADAANAVSAQLTTDQLQSLDTAVAGGKDPATVAAAWVAAHGLG